MAAIVLAPGGVAPAIDTSVYLQAIRTNVETILRSVVPMFNGFSGVTQNDYIYNIDDNLKTILTKKALGAMSVTRKPDEEIDINTIQIIESNLQTLARSYGINPLKSMQSEDAAITLQGIDSNMKNIMQAANLNYTSPSSFTPLPSVLQKQSAVALKKPANASGQPTDMTPFLKSIQANVNLLLKPLSASAMPETSGSIQQNDYVKNIYLNVVMLLTSKQLVPKIRMPEALPPGAIDMPLLQAIQQNIEAFTKKFYSLTSGPDLTVLMGAEAGAIEYLTNIDTNLKNIMKFANLEYLGPESFVKKPASPISWKRFKDLEARVDELEQGSVAEEEEENGENNEGSNNNANYGGYRKLHKKRKTKRKARKSKRKARKSKRKVRK